MSRFQPVSSKYSRWHRDLDLTQRGCRIGALVCHRGQPMGVAGQVRTLLASEGDGGAEVDMAGVRVGVSVGRVAAAVRRRRSTFRCLGPVTSALARWLRAAPGCPAAVNTRPRMLS